MVRFTTTMIGASMLLRSNTMATSSSGSIAKSIFVNQNRLLNSEERRRKLENHNNNNNRPAKKKDLPFDLLASLNGRDESNGHHRQLEADTQAQCDVSFLNCLPNIECVDCFTTLEMEDIDWTGVTPQTACADVVQFLLNGGHCEKMKDDSAATETFCATFDACVVWEVNDDDDWFDDDDDGANQDGFVNCTALTSCDWPGIKANWLGDGICHDNMHGCYNTALCDWDGGDCCQDTCDDGGSEYKKCGADGYACRDPSSANCDSKLTAKCATNSDSSAGDDPDAGSVPCAEGEQKYRLVMYDSFGDGWDTTTITITNKATKQKVFTGALESGSQGTQYICLPKESACVNAVTSGGSWGVEVSWEVKPMKDGSPAIAGGGSPDDCDFPVAGAACVKTCDGKPDTDPTKDPNYKTFKELSTCIGDKCMIQVGACEKSDICEACFQEELSDYCYGVATFNAVIDCTMCKCTEKKDSDYCAQKTGGGAVAPSDKDDDNSAPKKCSGQETMMGAKAVMTFSACAKLDDIGVMVTDFDQSNFGQLDQFETCAHSYTNDANHGGHTALGCMQILYNAMTNPVAPTNNKNPPKDAISALARDLYNNGEAFCDCAKKASDDCPLCPSFMNFKTLLYESLDACSALDEIDCDSWSEFWFPCQSNLQSKFGKSDFRSADQCDFAKNGCNNVGAFPAFRRLDCGGEIADDAWEFYNKFSRNCLKGDDGKPPDVTPAPGPAPTAGPKPAATPTNPPTAPDSKPTAVDKPTMKPYIPSDGSNPKPYVPSDDSNSKPYIPSDQKAQASKKKSKFLRNFFILAVLAGVGYYVYKKRSDSFNFVQYRRVRNFGNFGYGFHSSGDDGGMYSNLNSSTTFEPPSLPPTPQMLGGPSMMGGNFMGTEMT